jgi:ATP-dependent Clp protease ATP-binding subunit ClpA
LEERHISLELTDKVRDYLAREGYDPVFGARPLKRVIQRRILDALATSIIKGEIKEGDHVVADMSSGGIEEVRFTSREI